MTRPRPKKAPPPGDLSVCDPPASGEPVSDRASSDACKGLPPVARADIRVLILGSMPGSESLRRAEYYAHPRNLFWDFIEELFGIPRMLPYAQRLNRLNRSGVGLWDVVARCRRRGSLDAAIDRASIVPNDFERLFMESPRLRAVCFNGRAAAELYLRHVAPQSECGLRRPELITLPSTSPANASVSLIEKRARWATVRQYLPGKQRRTANERDYGE